jgi:hypothetical protein
MTNKRINPNIIVASADLLDAIKALLEDYYQLAGDGMTEENQPDCVRAARAAIDKAEGREREE